MAKELPTNQIIQGDWVDVLKTLPDKIVHCGITSPPYWGQRNYGVEGQLGFEKTPEEHIDKLVAGFREFRRVLRDDGVLWLNYGDKYDEGDLLGLPWMLAFALRKDGWYLRSDIVWAKALSFCPTYSGSTMPESVKGWRWERHKIKVGSKKGCKQTTNPANYDVQSGGKETAIWKPCPGCPKCEPNDGLVLRRGAWRPTRAHEYLFLLTKTDKYYCDAEAVREEMQPESAARYEYAFGGKKSEKIKAGENPTYIVGNKEPPSGRNLRDVWCINPQPYPLAHYATFPEKLVEPCIKAGTSEKGCCPKCGSQWARMVDTKQLKRERPADKTDRHKAGKGINACGNTVAGVETTTLGWRSTCKHNLEPVPCIVYDPFMGSGTVAAVTARLGRNYLGSELNPEYLENQAKYRMAEAETGISIDEQLAGQMALFDRKT